MKINWQAMPWSGGFVLALSLALSASLGRTARPGPRAMMTTATTIATTIAITGATGTTTTAAVIFRRALQSAISCRLDLSVNIE